MRFLPFCVLIALFLAQCNTPSKITDSDSNNEIENTTRIAKEDYPVLNPTQNYEDFVKQHYSNKDNQPHYIAIKGKVAEMIHQHMMKASFDNKESHVYIDIVNSDGGQLVGYYKPSTLKIPEDNQTHLFLGTLHSMTGAGKGGGMHTEWYIDLDGVE